MKYITRDSYLDFLKQNINKPIIKVISGVRRSGKSTLFVMFRQWIEEQNPKANVISINFEDLDFEKYKDYQLLYSYITSLIIEDRSNYVFLDEIQHVDMFEKVVDSLFIKNNVDVYITGSNAYFMSGELATLLSGRYIELKVLPLSFKEFYSWHIEQETKQTRMQLFNLYLTSSFPYALFSQNHNELLVYLEGLYNTVLINDIVARKNISDVRILKRVIDTLFSSIGSEINTNKITNTLRSQNISITNITLERWLEAILDSFLMYQIRRYDIHGRKILNTGHKLYVVDIGLRNLKLRDHHEDRGHILENIVFLELKRRGYEVYVGRTRHYEVDFVAIKGGSNVEYFQVSEDIANAETFNREMRSLQEIKDNYPKTLLSMTEFMADSNYQGIVNRNLIDWLLD